MKRLNHHHTKLPKPLNADVVGGGLVLPRLETAEQIANVLQVSARTVHLWAASETIPTALRCGRVVRFSLPDVAAALGIHLPESGQTYEKQNYATSTTANKTHETIRK